MLQRRVTPHGAGMDIGLLSKDENKVSFLFVPFSLPPRGEAPHTGTGHWSAGWLCIRARVAHGFRTTASRAHPLGDDDHNNNVPGHGPRRGRWIPHYWIPRQCGRHDGHARCRHRDRDPTSATSAPVGDRAGPTGSPGYMGRRLLDVERLQVSMDGGPLGIAAECACRMGRANLAATGPWL